MPSCPESGHLAVLSDLLSTPQQFTLATKAKLDTYSRSGVSLPLGLTAVVDLIHVSAPITTELTQIML